MSQIIDTLADLADVGKTFVELARTKKIDQHSQLTGTVIKTRRDFEEFRAIIDFPYAQIVEEDGTVTYSNITSPYSLDISPDMRMLAFKCSKQMNYTDLYNKLKNPASRMGLSLAETRNRAFARAIELGFTAPSSGGTKTLDAIALFSASHLIEGGATNPSRPSADLALTVPNVKTGLTQLRTQKSHRGKPMVNAGENYLWVAAANDFQAMEIANGANLAHTTDHTVNSLKGRITPVVLDYMTTSGFENAWGFINKENNPLAVIERIPMFFETKYEPEQQRYHFYTGEEYVYFSRDSRGVWGTDL